MSLKKIHTVLEINEEGVPRARNEEVAKKSQVPTGIAELTVGPVLSLPASFICDWEYDYTSLNKVRNPRRAFPFP